MNDPRAEDPRAGEGSTEPPGTTPPAASTSDTAPDLASESVSHSAEQQATEAAAEPETRREPPRDDTPPPPPRGGHALGIVALLFSLLALAAAGFAGWQLFEQREAAAEHRAGTAERLADMRERLAASQERLAVQEERLAGLGDAAADSKAAIEELGSAVRQAGRRIDALEQEEAGPERSPSIAEIEFLLLLAGRELKLGNNPRVALAALREADRRAARLEEPGLAEVRAAINDEIAAVEAVAEIDIEGLALRLASLARRIEGLPLSAGLSPDPVDIADAEAEGGWARLAERGRAVATGMFRIRRTDAPARPLLAPDESFFLYRNVELDLKSARLAALSGDQDNFLAGLEAARDSLERYFETDDESVKAVLSAIRDLEGRDVAPEWPEITRSLGRLRAAGAGN